MENWKRIRNAGLMAALFLIILWWVNAIEHIVKGIVE